MLDPNPNPTNTMSTSFITVAINRR